MGDVKIVRISGGQNPWGRGAENCTDNEDKICEVTSVDTQGYMKKEDARTKLRTHKLSFIAEKTGKAR